MRRPPAPRRVALALLLGLFLAGTPTPDGTARAGAPAYQAGFGVVDLTPEGPVPLGGYAARLGLPARGFRDPIEARALVLEHGDAAVALVTLDLVGVDGVLTNLIRRRVADLDLDDVILAATHTHTGPGALTRVPLWRPAMGRYDAALFARTAARVEAAIRRAHAARAPVVLRHGRTPARSLAARVRCRAAHGRPPDASMGVVRIEDLDGAVRGVLVHFAAHPTLLGGAVMEGSAGWPGALRRRIEARLSGATAFFVQGCLGDVSPVAPADAPPDAFARAEAYGRALADAALVQCEALGARAPERGALVVEGTRALAVPTTAAALLGGRPETALLGTWPVRVARVRVGDLELVTLPGEPVQAFGDALGRGDGRWIVACAQDHLGYLVDRSMLRAAEDYEAELCLFGPELQEAVAALVTGEAAAPSARFPAPVASLVDPIVLRPPTEDPGARGLGRAHGHVLAAPVRTLLAEAERELQDTVLDGGGGLLLAPARVATGLAPRALVIPALVRAARRLQQHVPAALLDEMEGVAAGAGVPYDAILLENVFLTLAEQPRKSALLTLPVRCTNVVATGEATSMGQLLHGSTLDWGMREVLQPRVVTLVVEPPEGHPFVSITWPGMVGTLRTMGAQGLALTEESCAAPDDTTLDGLPLGLLLRDVVQHADGLEDAVRRLREAPGTCGYKVTVSDGRALDARVVALTARRSHVRAPRDGLLFGCDPESPCVGECDGAIPRQDGSSARRYPVVRRRLEAQSGRIRMEDVMGALRTKEGGVFGSGTLLACAFEPQLGRFAVAAREDVQPDAGRMTFRGHDLPALLSPALRARYTPPWPVADAGPVTTRVKLEDFAGVRIEEVFFTSPVRSGVENNDRFRVELFTPKDPIGVVVQLPHWKDPSGAAGQKLVAMALARAGLASVVLPLPWQYGRTPEGLGTGDRTLSHDLARTREAAFQGVADVLRVGRWLEEDRGFAPSRQALLGLSLGGHVASLAYGAAPERFAGAALLLAGSHRGGTLFRENGVTDGILHRLRARGVTFEEAFALLGPIDPAALARPGRADRVLLIAGADDPVAPPESVAALAKAWGGARVETFPGDHYTVARHVPRILAVVIEHLRGCIEPAPPPR